MKPYKAYNKYIVRKMINYKTYTLTFNNKPKKADIKKALAEKIASLKNINAITTDTPKTTTTLKDILKSYASIKSNILSPTTIRSYYGTITTLEKINPKLLNTSIDNIDNVALQTFISKYALDHKPKTCINILSNITTPLKYFYPDKAFNIKTPQKIKVNIYIPTSNDIEALKKYFTNTEYETIFILSLYGLRQSEIQALTINDLNSDTNTLTINKAKVKGYKNIYYTKTTKTIESNRQIVITNYLSNLIQKQGYITKKSYTSFYNHFKRTCKRLNIKYFNPHKLRHYFASELHRLNIPTKYIQRLGGWATDNVLKNIYTHAIDAEALKINNQINKILF